jgi:hypothetical protein
MKGGDAPVTTAEPKAPDTSPAGNNKIPDEWFDDDYGPSPESDKREPDGFTDRLVEKYEKARMDDAADRRGARGDAIDDH